MHTWNAHLKKAVETVLFDEAALAARIDELSAEICRDYHSLQAGEVLVIGILRGSVLFLSDLVRRLQMPLCLDFISASSYGSGTVSSGTVSVSSGELNLRGRHVLLVEDIIDSGNTLSRICADFLQQQPASLKICTLLDKPSRREVDLAVDYCGFEVEDNFVVGYGLDFDGRYRHLPYIAVLRPECYQAVSAG